MVAIGIAGSEPPEEVEAIAAATPVSARVAGMGRAAADEDEPVRPLAGS